MPPTPPKSIVAFAVRSKLRRLRLSRNLPTPLYAALVVKRYNARYNALSSLNAVREFLLQMGSRSE